MKMSQKGKVTFRVQGPGTITPCWIRMHGFGLCVHHSVVLVVTRTEWSLMMFTSVFLGLT